MNRILLEVCVDDPDGLEAAVAGGADRVELCSALCAGGLTPSPGLMSAAGMPPVPVYAMIRPRAGDFVYDAADLEVMRRDIDAARAAGLAGVVLGASRADGRLDARMLTKLAGHAAGMGLTLHRAFDLVPDFAEALEIAVELGFERILTSGGAKTAPEAVEILEKLIAAASGRISIMPGSGITSNTAGTLLPRLAIAEVHSSCSTSEPANDMRLVEMGFAAPERRRTDAAKIRAMRACLDALAAKA
ncbi:copper homeostasis protein CutC [Sinorhizobium medicae]|uniref:PF03932 family protein CutC n=3 Tax=Sinorhizobium medicae TaxID=110321 RepID=CUTC_SINMW|nr:copper homeostasis protein CutC [Sinorhizobium medicae]A6UF02.1 RecName: Full=PF03932 family protein CutC [Sinorhizobium medicae WSM419]ABR62232.1 CutC family protein [Sinorhizobium medicae WSM419]MBO1940890.1 copper homeostasis protein CutC [Sinorhizobium medicae]MBO1964136.1 copper homeostasis protein CutC [Sinorhizobium medicae]MDX0405885.1 copper homeostasis protein CutC [Sinorhizobium medicae]MDX0411446.1 copper homeostasis protein CutC [Sinorhizobium medicae]